MRQGIGTITIGAMVIAAACSTEAVERGNPVDPADVPAAAEASNALAADLYRKLVLSDDNANLFFSPFSISSALAMTWEGARQETAQQMQAVLHVPMEGDELWPRDRMHSAMSALMRQFNQEDQPFELVVANALWGERTMPFRQAFLDAIGQHYEAGLSSLDFRGQAEVSRQQINAWVEHQTAQRIKDLMPQGSITADTRLVLTNAIYFKAAWASPFQPRQTQDRDFHLADGTTVQVPTMHKSDVRVGYHTDEALQVVDIPYEGRSLSMMIALPTEPGGLAALEAELSGTRWGEWSGAMRWQSARLYLPRFRVETDYELNDPLKALGMELAFDAERADFTAITDSAEGRELHISTVVHKAFIDVDEKGTEAAAATGVAIGVTSLPMDPPTIRVDRPFVFVIRDRDTGTILFMGRVMDPR